MKKMKCKQMGADMGMFDEMHKGMMLRARKVQKKLDLSRDQKAKLKKILSEETRKSIKSEADIKTLHLDLMDLMDESPLDNSQIDSKIDEIAAAFAAMAKIKTYAMQETESILTPEQKEMWMEMKEKIKVRGKKIKGLKREKGR